MLTLGRHRAEQPDAMHMPIVASLLLALTGAVVGCAAPIVVAPDELGPPMKPAPGVVRVHLESTDPARPLEILGYGASRLEPVGDGTFRAHTPTQVLCKAPCDAVIDVRGTEPLVVGGLGVPTSAPLVLEELEGDVRITAEPGSNALSTTGTVFAGVGGLGALVGAGVFVLGLVTRTGEVTDTPDALMTGGGIAMGASAAVLGAGLLMRYFGATYVEVTPEGVAW